ncbi:MAG: sulfite exporter TauE/SafE family protein [Lentisphaerae bacterium]|jgi:uncharacterized protein|nr:sulfite exporter TauE/SafE family protein [Lentisphaerota bacterium]MBT4818125.1 sulfite exporter TauE/SafE family protein [Lentisphaerota bacterium]MBT5608170.1 sulfite exporter TauE/SafE family protein [Lentisphaerota bacterium]MBT7058941.1 sulfite exporter TauE/SafE family protein [Lentisphaerota bacterium]MBT7842828.1 sulfite exporter TauE/SafE family protein [Lentisphaerota bacterium]
MPISLLTLMLIAGFAAFTQGFCGFGYGIVTMALLSLLTAEMERGSVFVMLSIVVLLLDLMRRSKSHGGVDWPKVGLLFLGLMAGQPLGYWFVLNYDKMGIFRVAFGVALILFAVYGIVRPHVKRRIPTFLAPVFGFFCGVLSGAFASGGPPAVIYFYSQEDDPRRAIGSLQAIFLLACFFRIGVVLVGGKGIGGRIMLQSALVAPVILVVTGLAHRLSRRVSPKLFLIVVYGLIVAAGITNVAKGLGGW